MISDAAQHIGEPGLGIDAVEFGSATGVGHCKPNTAAAQNRLVMGCVPGFYRLAAKVA